MTLEIKAGGLRGDAMAGADPIQVCFTVSDLDRGVRDFARTVKAGPWFRVAPLAAAQDQTTHRGIPTPLGADIALAYAGNTMYELVAPRAGSESIFAEWVSRFGVGLHHFGFGTANYDASLVEMKRSGKEPVMTSVTARNARVAMFESDGPMDVLNELIEIRPESADFYTRLKMAAQGWTEDQGLYTDLSD